MDQDEGKNEYGIGSGDGEVRRSRQSGVQRKASVFAVLEDVVLD